MKTEFFSIDDSPTGGPCSTITLEGPHHAARGDALASLSQEREYQEERWNADTTESGGQHEVSAFLLYMEHHLQKARTAASSLPEPQASIEAMAEMRKVAALYVAAAEQHGASFRHEPDLDQIPSAETPLGTIQKGTRLRMKPDYGPHDCTVTSIRRGGRMGEGALPVVISVTRDGMVATSRYGTERFTPDRIGDFFASIIDAAPTE